MRIPAGVGYFLGGSPKKHDGKEKGREDREEEKGSAEDPNSLPRSRAPVTGV